MPVWSIEPVGARPSVSLRSWRAYEVPLNGPEAPWTLHVVGYSLEDESGQVSSAIQAFDPESACCRSRSGRVYLLMGAHGSNADAEYTWQRWKEVASLVEDRDVSGVVFSAIVAAARKGWRLPPLDNPHVVRAREILRTWSDEQFAAWWNNRSSFLGGRRPRDLLESEPELGVAGAKDQYEGEQYCG